MQVANRVTILNIPLLTVLSGYPFPPKQLEHPLLQDDARAQRKVATGRDSAVLSTAF
jgi:hypothetical protein